jgi:hypothetical protein
MYSNAAEVVPPLIARVSGVPEVVAVYTVEELPYQASPARLLDASVSNM